DVMSPKDAAARRPRAGATSTTDQDRGSGPRPGELLRLRAKFASIIARPGTRALLINADNTSGGWVPIRVAIRRGGAFAVETADDVLALDQDDASLAPALDRIAVALRDTGHFPVRV